MTVIQHKPTNKIVTKTPILSIVGKKTKAKVEKNSKIIFNLNISALPFSSAR